MIEHLKHKYLEEAHDLLLELEKTLLLLEDNPADTEGVEVAFRVMHTLKGNSGMCGYQQVSELVHLLENGYDSIRSTQQAVPTALLNISLEAVDHIRNLLSSTSATDPETQDTHKLLLKKSAEMLYEVVSAEETVEKPDQEKKLCSWAIWFRPNNNFLSNGSNPLYLLEELAGLGQLTSFLSTAKVPDLAAIDPKECSLSWLLLLVTEASENTIRETFLFVEDLCELQIQLIAEKDVVKETPAAVIAALQERVAAGLDSASFAGLAAMLMTATTPKPTAAKNIEEDKSAIGQLPASVKERNISSIRVASDKLDGLMNLVSELVANQERLTLLAEMSLIPELSSVAEEIEKITRSLRDKTFDICLVPISSLLTRFKRLVRDLSQELGKNIVFDAEGVETELDKNVVDSLSECLVHIFRNSIDHGIEEESERLRKGKDAQGKIILKAYNSGTNVIIEVQDDGAGVNLERVRQKALEKGLIKADLRLTDQEVLELLFMPGFTTAQGVTAVSGRGVGMDVVRKKIKELRGDVKISSRAEKGTTITIALPLTISILDGLLVRVADTDFVLPLSFVEKSYSVTKEDIDNAINNQLVLDGEPTIYFNLADAFAYGTLNDTAFGVVVKVGQMRMVLLVDQIIGEYQAVLKPLGKFYQDQDFLSGGSLKGDGTVALVLDPHKLIQEITMQTILTI